MIPSCQQNPFLSIWMPKEIEVQPQTLQRVTVCAPSLSQAVVPDKLPLWSSARIVLPCAHQGWVSSFTLPGKQGKIHKHLTPISTSGPSSTGDCLTKVLSVRALLLPSCNLPSPLSHWEVVTFLSHGNQWSLGVFLWPCWPSLKKWDSRLLFWGLSARGAMQIQKSHKRLHQWSWEDASFITGGHGNLAT